MSDRIGSQPRPAELRARVESLRDEMVSFLSSLATVESPTEDPASQGKVQSLIGRALTELGYRVRILPGVETGGHLFASPRERRKGAPVQLLMGHSDTVWPMGTLATMPVVVKGARLYGPGTFDMKGGVTQMVFALRALQELGVTPAVTPIVFINSDEETGSPESREWVGRLSRRCCRALILEPALGSAGLIKTARKGVGRFTLKVRGRPAHAGLDPGGGANAILELAGLIPRLHGLSDPHRGISVNVGVIDGGIRPNVIAPESRAEIDVRVLTERDGEAITRAIYELQPVNPEIRLEVSGGMEVPPLERTERNRALWNQVQKAGSLLGLQLSETTAGGGSDGNTTSQFTATVDGLGPVGDGAHAVHEHVEVAGMIERCALLAEVLRCPAGSRA